MTKKIVVFDFGSDYNEEIVKKVKLLGIDSYLIDYQTLASDLAKDKDIIGIILSGSRKSVYAEDGKIMDPKVYNLGLPILGICYGMQLMAYQLGGKVEAMGFSEEEDIELIIEKDNPLLSSNSIVHMNHGDHVVILPLGFTNYAHTPSTKHGLMINEAAQLYATQFHPEKDESGVIDRFVLEICQ
jgi:GMP synthase (glutamine-hydrolysing)